MALSRPQLPCPPHTATPFPDCLLPLPSFPPPSCRAHCPSWAFLTLTGHVNCTAFGNEIGLSLSACLPPSLPSSLPQILRASGGSLPPLLPLRLWLDGGGALPLDFSSFSLQVQWAAGVLTTQNACVLFALIAPSFPPADPRTLNTQACGSTDSAPEREPGTRPAPSQCCGHQCLRKKHVPRDSEFQGYGAGAVAAAL